MSIFRVADNTRFNNFLSDLSRQRANLETTRQQVSSGLRVSEPGDDPSSAGAIIQFQRTVQRIQGYQERIATTQGFMESQQSALESSSNILQRAREIATQAANETIDGDLRRGLSEEVFQLRDSLVSIANTKYRGVYVYGGQDDDDPPFDESTTPYTEPATGSAHTRIVYDDFVGNIDDAGNDDTRDIRISDTETMRINTRGDEVFSHAIAGLERLARALAGYRTEPNPFDGAPSPTTDFSDLPDGGGTAYNLPTDFDEQTADILSAMDYVQYAKDEIISVEATSVGSRINRLDETNSILDSVKFSTLDAKANVQEVDMFESIATFSNLQTNLEALMSTGAQISQLSLLNFL